MNVEKREMAVPALIFACGISAGFLNGLLGCGGGIVIVTLLNLLTKKTKFDERDVFAASVASVLPMSAVSAVMYIRSAEVNVTSVADYVLPALAGGVTGAFLLDKLDTFWVKKIFSILMTWAGVSLVLSGLGVM